MATRSPTTRGRTNSIEMPVPNTAEVGGAPGMMSSPISLRDGWVSRDASP